MPLRPRWATCLPGIQPALLRFNRSVQRIFDGGVLWLVGLVWGAGCRLRPETRSVGGWLVGRPRCRQQLRLE